MKKKKTLFTYQTCVLGFYLFYSIYLLEQHQTAQFNVKKIQTVSIANIFFMLYILGCRPQIRPGLEQEGQRANKWGGGCS